MHCLQFFQKVEDWLDECMEKHFPDGVEKAEGLLSKHAQLKETYQELYSSARQDGHKIIDRLKRPVGEGSLPTPFVIGTRHIKEILESLFDERNWLDEQWQRRQLILTQALNLRKYQKEAKKVGGVCCDHMINHMIAPWCLVRPSAYMYVHVHPLLTLQSSG